VVEKARCVVVGGVVGIDDRVKERRAAMPRLGAIVVVVVVVVVGEKLGCVTLSLMDNNNNYWN